ncbi:hypothetical protein [uncultured Litoreibacter sp.]|uniref:hypothetical protein n=1 Tax=uncultured Litoreibacter sp. TaxID=1392394 RepID=UPI00262B05BC|nr:hypothetical protein [uncultured Litoreibacter sp.]
MTRLSKLRDAADIHQAHLDALSIAQLSGDFDAFLAGIGLPHTMICEDTETLIESPAHLERLFFSFHRTLTSQGVTEFVRLSTGADFITPDAICGQHETHIIRDGFRLVAPYANRLRLERLNGGWFETKAANAVKCDGDRMLMPRPSRSAQPPKMPSYVAQRELTQPPRWSSENAQD